MGAWIFSKFFFQFVFKFFHNKKLWRKTGEGDRGYVQKGGDICIPMADSCWGLTENNKILWSNYPSIKKKINFKKCSEEKQNDLIYIDRRMDTLSICAKINIVRYSWI